MLETALPSLLEKHVSAERPNWTVQLTGGLHNGAQLLAAARNQRWTEMCRLHLPLGSCGLGGAFEAWELLSYCGHNVMYVGRRMPATGSRWASAC